MSEQGELKRVYIKTLEYHKGTFTDRVYRELFIAHPLSVYSEIVSPLLLLHFLIATGTKLPEVFLSDRAL